MRGDDWNVIRAEIIGSETASALGITVTGHTPVLTLCRALIKAGYSQYRGMKAYRGQTLCLIIRSIGEASRLVVRETPKTCFRPHTLAPWYGRGAV